MIDIDVEDLDELQKNRPMISLTFDKMLKAFFDRNPIVFKRFISSVLHLELLPDEINLKVKNSELPVSHYNEYSKTIDFYADINGTYLVDIELNNCYFSSLKIRNKFYHEKKIGSLMKKGMSSKDIKKLGEIANIQLNLNVKDKSTNLGEDIVVPYSIVSHTLYVNNDKTYIRYLDYYRNLYYNSCDELDESDYWLALLTSRDYVEFNDILSKFVDDNLRIELVKDVIFLSNDDYLFSEEERMNLDLLVKFEEEKRIEQEKKQMLEDGYKEGMQKGIEQGIEQGIKEGIEQGIKEGIEQGIEQGKSNQIKSFIKNLMDNNVSLENISLYCKLPIDEVKTIIDSLDV